MKYLILTFFCNLLSLGHLQETNNLDAGKSPKSDWPLQTLHSVHGNFYSQVARNANTKPCSTRLGNAGSEPIEHQLSPPLASIVGPSSTVAATLKPQTLRNGEQDLKITDNQELHSIPQLTLDENHLYKNRNSLTVSNPVIDSFEENHHEIIIPADNKAIQEDNLKPLNHMYFASNRDFHPAVTSEVRSGSSRSYQSPPNALNFDKINELANKQEHHYISKPSNVIASDPNELRSAQLHKPSTAKSDTFPESTGDFHPHKLPTGQVTKIRTDPKESPALKCSHDEESDNLLGHSRRSMSSYNDEENAEEILSIDKESLRKSDDPYIESQIDNENAMASVLNVEENDLSSRKDDGLSSLDKSKSPDKAISRVGRPQYNDARREMIEPTKGSGITNMGQSSLMLMQTEKICYACSTANNPSCWAPDRRTTVKYCRKGNNACITKTFGKGSTFTLIRDCGNSCDDSEMGGLMPRYKSCSMCHTELCNGGYSINGHSITFALIITALVKYLN